MSATERELVLSTARLARLSIGEQEAAQLGSDFARILAAFRDLARIDVAGFEPLTGPAELAAALREDEPRPSLARERLLALAPEPLPADAPEFFGVPKTVETAPEFER